MDNADNVKNIPHGGLWSGDTVRPQIIFPIAVWKEAKKAAIDRGVTAQQFVIDVISEYLGLKAA